MKLKEFLENINKMVSENPAILELDVVNAIDDEGNGYEKVYYSPSLGFYDSADKEFTSKDQFAELEASGYEDLEINSICIN